MLNFLVETKNEYTAHLITILTPLIYEGLQSIYKEAENVAQVNDILKIFQSFLRRVPKWNNDMIQKESDRIINNTRSSDWLSNLIKATIKAHTIVLMYNPNISEGNQAKVDPKYYRDIQIPDFIHKVYIECARELYNNPYLMYNKYTPIELKRNQRDTMVLIKECIKDSIRKLLPVKQILENYLGEELENKIIGEDNFDKNISAQEERNIDKLIKKDLDTQHFIVQEPNNDTPNNPTNRLSTNNETPKPPTIENQSEKSLGSKILNILGDNSVTSSDVASVISKNSRNTMSQNSNMIPPPPIPPVNSVDEKIKKLLEKDLADNDLETSINYTQDNENKYQDIFSNSNITPNISNKQNIQNTQNTQNTQNSVPNDEKEKKRFFNNYLHF